MKKVLEFLKSLLHSELLEIIKWHNANTRSLVKERLEGHKNE